jgi:hypothetical protein
MLTQKQKFDRYGKNGDWDNFVRRELPFTLYVAGAGGSVYKWTKIWVHKKIADNLIAAFECLLDHYGLDEIKRLSIDQCGGCVNNRKMRGGTKWSSHAWGIAIDLFPNKNGIRTRAPEAAFSREEYEPLHRIMEEHNFINYGKVKGFDWMHFEIKD